MNEPRSLEGLEIVGYANVLKETMLPSVVPPVFRLTDDPRRALLPPYSLNAGYLCNATEVTEKELRELRDSDEITLFEGAFQARRDFELWVDQSFQWHYEPREEVHRDLAAIARGAIQDSEAALREGDFGRAERLLGVAISADDRRVEPLAIKAAIRRRQGNKAGERLMAELAKPFLDERLFALLVEDYYKAMANLQPVARTGSHNRAMHGMACRAA